MVTYSQLKDAKPDLFTEAGREWDTWADKIDGHIDEFSKQVRDRLDDGSVWRSQEAPTAVAHCDSIKKAIFVAVDDMRKVAEALKAAGRDIGAAKHDLDRALEMAESEGLTIRDDGGITIPPSPPGMSQEEATDFQKKKHQAAADINSLIQGAVQRATQTDHQTAGTLRQYGVKLPDAETVARNVGNSQSDGHRAAELAKKAPLLSDEELKELRDLLRGHEGDPFFATAFMQDMGPRGLLYFGGELVRMTPYDGDGGERLGLLADIQKELGNTLATATDTDQEPHVDTRWVDDLEKAGRQKIDIGLYNYQPYGYQVLGVLLKEGNYGKSFLDDVGADMYSFEVNSKDKANIWAENTPQGAMYNGFTLDLVNKGQGGFDPMTGLMDAMSHNPDAAKAFFDPAHDKSGEPGRVDYLLSDRIWHADMPYGEMIPKDYQSPGIDYLGNALDAATTGHVHDPASARIMSETVHRLGSDLHGNVPANMRDSVGHMISSYIGDVNHAVHTGGDWKDSLYGEWDDPAMPGSREYHALFDVNELNRVMSSAAHDPNAYVQMYNAERAYTAIELDHAAGDPDVPDMDERAHNIQVKAGDSAKIFGTLDDAKADAIKEEYEGKDAAYNAAIERNGKIANFVFGKVIDHLPVPGAGLIGQGGEAYINALVEGSKHDSSQIARDEIAQQYGDGRAQAADLAQQAMWRHKMWPGHHGPPASLIGPDGKPVDLSDLSDEQWNDYQQWTDSSGYNDYIGRTLQEIDQDYSVGERRLYEAQGGQAQNYDSGKSSE